MKKIWVNDGKKVTEYEAVSEGHAPTPAPSAPAPSAPASMPADYAMQETSMTETPSEAVVVADSSPTVETSPVVIEETPMDDGSEAKSRFYESVKGVARATPGAASAYSSDVASGARRVSGRAAQWAQALNRQYQRAQPVLSEKYAAIAKQIAEAQAPPKKRRSSSSRRRSPSGMRKGSGGGSPKVTIIKRR